MIFILLAINPCTSESIGMIDHICFAVAIIRKDYIVRFAFPPFLAYLVIIYFIRESVFFDFLSNIGNIFFGKGKS